MNNKLIAIIFLLIPLSLDVKGAEQGGGFFQYLLAVLCLVAAAWLVIFVRPVNKGGNLIGNIILASIFYSIIPMLIWDSVVFSNYVRVLFPYILFYAGYVCVGRLSNGEIFYSFGIICIGCFLSVVVGFFNGVMNLNSPVFGGRYLITSPVVILAFGVSFYLLLKRAGIFFINIICLFCSSLVILTGGTRSLILCAIGVVSLLVFFGVDKKPDRIRLIVLMTKVSIVFIFFAAILIPGAVEQTKSMWLERIESRGLSDVDLTTETRLAEIDWQWQNLTESVFSMFVGRGFGSVYYWGGESFDLVRSMLGSSYEVNPVFEAGHNFWIYNIYSNGIVVGLFLPACVVFLGVKSLYLCATVRDPYIKYMCTMGAVGIWSALFLTIGGNPMGPRYSALLLGYLCGVVSFSGGGRVGYFQKSVLQS